MSRRTSTVLAKASWPAAAGKVYVLSLLAGRPVPHIAFRGKFSSWVKLLHSKMRCKLYERVFNTYTCHLLCNLQKCIKCSNTAFNTMQAAHADDVSCMLWLTAA